MVSDGAHTHVSFRSTESVVILSAARVLQKPAPSLSDLCVCVCVCAFVRISEARHPWSRFRSLQGVCIRRHLRRGRRCCLGCISFYQCYTRVYVADAGTAEKPWSVMSDIRTYTCVLHKHTWCVVTVPVCGVCRWCLVTQTCVFANGGVARTGAHVISHTCVWPMQYYAENPWYLRTHMCVAKARNPWSRFGLPGTFSDCTY